MNDQPTIIAQVTHTDADGTITNAYTIAATNTPTPAAITTPRHQPDHYNKALTWATAQATKAVQVEAHHALVGLIATTLNACPHVTSLTLTPSDQGEWLQFDHLMCPTHTTHPDVCPAVDAIDLAPHNYASHLDGAGLDYATGHLHLVALDKRGTRYSIDTRHLPDLENRL